MVTGRIERVVVLCINDCARICLGGLNIDRVREWSSYRGARLNRFVCNVLT